MPAICPHCQLQFSSSRGLFGQDAEVLRDAHSLVCDRNPRNKCFCGRVFPNSGARDNHATTCELNPANRFKCLHCPQEFVTGFGVTGLFRSDGKALRDAHANNCKDNPANKCYCGRVFPDVETRNAHAAKCDLNPNNCFKCAFCPATFMTTYNMLGFCASDGRVMRDSHQAACDKNPTNACYCGRVFSSLAAKLRHEATCEANPANRFQCPHCSRLFVTRFGVMGMIATNGKALRDAHEQGCDMNVANTCFCGQRFLNPSLRDAHALACDMNPVNRFKCYFCSATFVTTFGIFGKHGSLERDAHLQACRNNPTNAACAHCNATFTDAKGWVTWFDKDAQECCSHHMAACELNPKNRCQCKSCGRSFVTKRRWLRKVEAKTARQEHQKACDVIPCSYHVAATGFADWQLLEEEADCEDGEETSTEATEICHDVPPELGETCQACSPLAEEFQDAASVDSGASEVEVAGVSGLHSEVQVLRLPGAEDFDDDVEVAGVSCLQSEVQVLRLPGAEDFDDDLDGSKLFEESDDDSICMEYVGAA